MLFFVNKVTSTINPNKKSYDNIEMYNQVLTRHNQSQKYYTLITKYKKQNNDIIMPI